MKRRSFIRGLLAGVSSLVVLPLTSLAKPSVRGRTRHVMVLDEADPQWPRCIERSGYSYVPPSVYIEEFDLQRYDLSRYAGKKVNPDYYVNVSLNGPVNEPVLIRSWKQLTRMFGKPQ